MSSPTTKPYIGGQAVIEGVMMRSPSSLAVVCRRKSGELVVRERALPPTTSGPRKWPLIRGVMTLVESLRLGSQALRFSAELYEQDLREEEARAGGGNGAGTASKVASAIALSIVSLVTSDPDRPAMPLPEPKKKGGLSSAIPFLFAIGLFIALPQAGAEGINKLFFDQKLDVTSPSFQAMTGIAKLVIVVGYLLAIRQVAEIRRVFQYHGAEHKTISTYEAGEELLVENARKKTTLHARCGTTFLVMVALVSIVVFSVAGGLIGKAFGDSALPGPRIVQNVVFFVLKLPFLPVVAAITYELQRFFARYCTVGPLRVLLWPGFLVQKITTAEPDDAQIEVALGSLRATLWREAAVEAPAQPDRTFGGYTELLADPGYARS